MDNKQALVYWITERENIRLLKEKGQPAPWTNNQVMRETYFCNVDREDDKVTRWIRNNFRYTSETSNYFTLGMIAARLFNNPDTLLDIGQPTEDIAMWFHDMRNCIEYRQAEGLTIWNGAYIVSTNGKKMPKSEYCLMLLKQMCSQLPFTQYGHSLEGIFLKDIHTKLMSMDGLGSFMAAQVVADLKNTLNHPASIAHDWETFSAFGPGSLRGLSWYFEEKITPKNYTQSIDEVYNDISLELPDSILDKICYQNLQNCMCEFDKFMRVTQGTGRSKRKYKRGG